MLSGSVSPFITSAPPKSGTSCGASLRSFPAAGFSSSGSRPALRERIVRGGFERFARPRPEWSMTTDEEFAAFDSHCRASDYAETSAVWKAMGREAGFERVDELLIVPNRWRGFTATAIDAPSCNSQPQRMAGQNTTSLRALQDLAAYLAVAVEVEIERERGRTRVVRAVAAIDSGQAVNSDGIRNRAKAAFCRPSAGRSMKPSPSTKPASPASTGQAILSCASPACRTASRCI